MSCVLQHFQELHETDCGVKMLSRKLCTLCELEWLTFYVGWPDAGSSNFQISKTIWYMVTGNPSQQDQFLYIVCWFILFIKAEWSSWLKCCAIKQDSSVLVTKSIRQGLSRNLSEILELSVLAPVEMGSFPPSYNPCNPRQSRIQLHTRGTMHRQSQESTLLWPQLRALGVCWIMLHPESGFSGQLILDYPQGIKNSPPLMKFSVGICLSTSKSTWMSPSCGMWMISLQRNYLKDFRSWATLCLLKRPECALIR